MRCNKERGKEGGLRKRDMWICPDHRMSTLGLFSNSFVDDLLPGFNYEFSFLSVIGSMLLYLVIDRTVGLLDPA